jgi:hypothetical protein
MREHHPHESLGERLNDGIVGVRKVVLCHRSGRALVGGCRRDGSAAGQGGGVSGLVLDLWKLASVAGAFEPKDRYGARGRTGELSSIESV